MSKNFNHEDFSHWIFDLDNTLYPEDENIFPQVKKELLSLFRLNFKSIKYLQTKSDKDCIMSMVLLFVV